MLTPSPKMSLSSMMMSPTWMPIRYSIRLCGYVRILRRHAALDFDGAAHGIHGAGELDQHAVPGRLDDTPAVGGDGGIDKSFSGRLEPGQRAFLVRTHKAAISRDIRSQHRRKRRSTRRRPKGPESEDSSGHQSMAALFGLGPMSALGQIASF